MTLVDQSPLPIQIHHIDGTLVYVNKAWEQLWLVKAENVVGQYNILTDEQAIELGFKEAAENVLSGESVMMADLSFDPEKSGFSGRKHWVRPWLYSITKEKGEIRHIVVCLEECTALKESEERYNIIVENANEAIMVFQDGLIAFFNQRALDIAGYKAEDYIRQPFVKFVPPDYQDLVLERHRKRVAGEDVPNFYQTKILHKDGSEKWLQMNVIRTDWEGRPASLAFLVDITGQKNAEEELEQHRDRLEELVRDRTAALTSANKQLKEEIAERVRTEKALRESELKFRTLFDLSPPTCFAD